MDERRPTGGADTVWEALLYTVCPVSDVFMFVDCDALSGGKSSCSDSIKFTTNIMICIYKLDCFAFKFILWLVIFTNPWTWSISGLDRMNLLYIKDWHDENSHALHILQHKSDSHQWHGPDDLTLISGVKGQDGCSGLTFDAPRICLFLENWTTAWEKLQ